MGNGLKDESINQQVEELRGPTPHPKVAQLYALVMGDERKVNQWVHGWIVYQELTFQDDSDGIRPEALTYWAQGSVLSCKGKKLL